MYKLYTQEQAHYEPVAKGQDDCDDCQSFVAGEHRCVKVEGDIAPHGWCQLFVQIWDKREKTKEVV